MAAVLLIAHAPLASALAAVAQHAFPEIAPRLQAIDVAAGETPEGVEVRARALLESLAAQDAAGRNEVLILADVFGATPSNIAQRLTALATVNARCVTGVNVPMVWRTLNYLQEPLDQLVARAMAGGSQGVMQIANARPQNQTYKPSNDQDQRHHQQ